MTQLKSKHKVVYCYTEHAFISDNYTLIKAVIDNEVLCKVLKDSLGFDEGFVNAIKGMKDVKIRSLDDYTKNRELNRVYTHICHCIPRHHPEFVKVVEGLKNSSFTVKEIEGNQYTIANLINNYEFVIEQSDLITIIPEGNEAPYERRVVCAANKSTNTDKMVTSARHHDINMNEMIKLIHELETLKNEPVSDFKLQGFVDQHNVFMTREEAKALAVGNQQIRRKVGGDEERLYSENLY
ncbi:MAG: hypothetical protein M0R77_00305 [Gammaproteobacteria bacterium]|nr:hypothetical protein [Acholeplasmataceae bacterium]MCK9528996.1 hypothetical protein [Gammaproteobacteria bacterium]